MSFNSQSTSSHNIFMQKGKISRYLRAKKNAHHGAVIWLTGLSGSGKSTLAYAVEEVLFKRGCNVYVLDGDNVRHGLCSDLGFSANDRIENLRRVSEVANLFLDAGVVVVCAFISPYKKDRELIAKLFNSENYLEIFCNCSLSVCEDRDVKGLYRKARNGEILNFTGISSPYEAPDAPDLMLNTDTESVEVCVNRIIDLVHSRNILIK